jgi:hypothetical protein
MLTKSTTHAKAPLALLQRDQYGALHLSAHLQPPQLEEVKRLLKTASTQKSGIPAEHFTRSKNEFECLNNDVYDVIVVRGKVRGLVVQSRWYWKHLGKTRTRMTKTYYLLTAIRGKVTVVELDNATTAKRAKTTTKLGQLAGHYLGTTTVRCVTPLKAIAYGYKVVVKSDDGRLLSAFDGSEYQIDNWREEAARPNHGGGFYCYMSEDLAVSSTERGATFHASVTSGKKLVLCAVEIGGKRVEYAGSKVAVSRLRVVAEIREVKLCEA